MGTAGRALRSTLDRRPVIRALILSPVIGVFLWYAVRDLKIHLRVRKPSVREDLLHLGLGVSQIALTGGVLGMGAGWVAAGLAGIVLLGGLDEFYFHRGLPPEESDVHAKLHFAVFALLALWVIDVHR